MKNNPKIREMRQQEIIRFQKKIASSPASKPLKLTVKQQNSKPAGKLVKAS